MHDRIDPDGHVARTLRQRLDDAFRAEAEDAENDARNVALRSRTMGQVAHECMAHGRHLEVTVFATTLSGPVVHARGDLAVVRTDTDRCAYVHLSAPVVMRTLATRSPGRSNHHGAAPSFLAALRTLEMVRPGVEVLVPSSGPARGMLTAVTPDHLMLETGAGCLHVPLPWVGAVLAPDPEPTLGSTSPNFPSLGVS